MFSVSLLDGSSYRFVFVFPLSVACQIFFLGIGNSGESDITYAQGLPVNFSVRARTQKTGYYSLCNLNSTTTVFDIIFVPKARVRMSPLLT